MAPTQSKHLRKDWDEEQMVKAIKMVRERRWYPKAAKTFNVPRTTLQRLTYKTDLTPEEAAATKLGRKTVLGTQLENVLVEYVLTMESKFYGLTRSDLRRMAYMLAKRNNLPNPFQESGLAGNMSSRSRDTGRHYASGSAKRKAKDEKKKNEAVLSKHVS
ncbi:hypothetical protein EVAR_78262_1 [Eumeta japonica]|uniref:HTH psq-type domain-containing protein n=1 Tax=Eumeta variegata TaxID=151549 RepID=A0A4C1T3W1_EUMVA|nr:hypothetical protein EVAR_78262_1 [Eumeta japonica]